MDATVVFVSWYTSVYEQHVYNTTPGNYVNGIVSHILVLQQCCHMALT